LSIQAIDDRRVSNEKGAIILEHQRARLHAGNRAGESVQITLPREYPGLLTGPSPTPHEDGSKSDTGRAGKWLGIDETNSLHYFSLFETV
jgi:hypothetical protein